MARTGERHDDDFWGIVGDLDLVDADPTRWRRSEAAVLVVGAATGAAGLFAGIQTHPLVGAAGFVVWLATASWLTFRRRRALP